MPERVTVDGSGLITVDTDNGAIAQSTVTIYAENDVGSDTVDVNVTVEEAP